MYKLVLDGEEIQQGKLVSGKANPLPAPLTSNEWQRQKCGVQHMSIGISEGRRGTMWPEEKAALKEWHLARDKATTAFLLMWALQCTCSPQQSSESLPSKSFKDYRNKGSRRHKRGKWQINMGMRSTKRESLCSVPGTKEGYRNGGSRGGLSETGSMWHGEIVGRVTHGQRTRGDNKSTKRLARQGKTRPLSKIMV